MRIKTYIEIGEIETDVDIDHEDIATAITEYGDSKEAIFRSINNFASYMKAVTDEQIDKMTDSQKLVINKFLSEQAARFQCG